MKDFVTQPDSTSRFTVSDESTAQPPRPAAIAAPARPSHEQIAQRAYHIYIQRGRQDGECLENWKRAERELRRQAAAAAQGQQRVVTTPAARPAPALVVHATPAASPSMMGGRQLPRQATPPVPQGGRNARSQWSM